MRKFLQLARYLMVFPLGLALSGCLPSTGTPERLYPVALEMDGVRTTQAQLVAAYQSAVFSNPALAKRIRNEIIADRMYAIDVYYVQYENALTRESQEVGFGTLATAGALSTASSVFTPPATKTALSALSTVAIGVNGHYNSDILLAQTMRTIQKQMRASRNLLAANISTKQDLGVADYPLSAALSDLEEYYNAGTLTSGVIDTSTTVGIQETNTRDLKQDVTQAPPAQRPAIISGGVPGAGDMPKPVRVAATFMPKLDAAGVALQNFLDPKGTGVFDPKQVDAIEPFLNKITDPTTGQPMQIRRLPLVVRGAEFAAQRQTLVNALRAAKLL
jgi:hypothetical protein